MLIAADRIKLAWSGCGPSHGGGGVRGGGSGAGHDAGVLAAHVPSAMVFVRNPTGVSHSPEEHVEDADADRGAVALADVLAGLLTG